MWRLYGGEENGISIKTNLNSLKSCFECEKPIWISAVKYQNYTKEALDESDPYAPFVTKRADFKYEREVRALTDLTPWPADGPVIVPEDACEVRRSFDVNLTTLIREVVVGPQAKDYFVELVQSLLMQYGLDVEVRRSPLEYIPTFGDPNDFLPGTPLYDDPGEVYTDPITRYRKTRFGTPPST